MILSLKNITLLGTSNQNRFAIVFSGNLTFEKNYLRQGFFLIFYCIFINIILIKKVKMISIANMNYVSSTYSDYGIYVNGTIEFLNNIGNFFSPNPLISSTFQRRRIFF